MLRTISIWTLILPLFVVLACATSAFCDVEDGVTLYSDAFTIGDAQFSYQLPEGFLNVRSELPGVFKYVEKITPQSLELLAFYLEPVGYGSLLKGKAPQVGMEMQLTADTKYLNDEVPEEQFNMVKFGLSGGLASGFIPLKASRTDSNAIHIKHDTKDRPQQLATDSRGVFYEDARIIGVVKDMTGPVQAAKMAQEVKQARVLLAIHAQEKVLYLTLTDTRRGELDLDHLMRISVTFARSLAWPDGE